TPASWATSSRRSPGVRRRIPSGRPTSDGRRASRRRRRKSAKPGRSITLPSCGPGRPISRERHSLDVPCLVGPGSGTEAGTMTTTIANHPRTLGRTGPTVTSPGFGGMGLSGVYGQVDEEAGIEVIRSYLDAGGTLLDTGDFYAAGHNESLVRRALAGRDRGSVVLSVKFGAVLAPGGAMTGFDGRPEFDRHSLTYSLQRLGTDHVDIYRPARLDPDVPIEETVGAIAELVEQGYVRHIGLSEVGAATIRRAAAVAPISDLQIE